MTGIPLTIAICSMGIVAASAYQTSVIRDGMTDIANQHAQINEQQQKLTDKVGLLVLGQILTEDQKSHLPIIMQNEVKRIIAENAAAEANKAIQKGVQQP